jgi:hypothetical protein
VARGVNAQTFLIAASGCLLSPAVWPAALIEARYPTEEAPPPFVAHYRDGVSASHSPYPRTSSVPSRSFAGRWDYCTSQQMTVEPHGVSDTNSRSRR